MFGKHCISFSLSIELIVDFLQNLYSKIKCPSVNYNERYEQVYNT